MTKSKQIVARLKEIATELNPLILDESGELLAEPKPGASELLDEVDRLHTELHAIDRDSYLIYAMFGV
jgi:hypothetical protein